MPDDDFELVLAEPDALERARLATDLLSVYQQRSTELARLRRDAITEASAARTSTDVAIALGLSKARITQIRQGGPPSHRRFFGIGPIEVLIPERQLEVGGRPRAVIATEDDLAASVTEALLTSLSFSSSRSLIPPDEDWQPPPRDVVMICGPKSATAAVEMIASDPMLSFEPDEAGRWMLVERSTGRRFTSAFDDGDDTKDVGYLRRYQRAGQTTVHIAGVHSPGSMGVAHYLTEHVADLHQRVGSADFSMVIECTRSGEAITTSRALCPPLTA